MEKHDIHVAMEHHERILLEGFLRCTRRYLEFGTGGSTHLAAGLVHESVVSVDSSEVWLKKVRDACEALSITPDLIFVDIGPTRDWGYPIDETAKYRWPIYSTGIWDRIDPSSVDFCLVDGRFRVATFLMTLLRCRPSTFIAIHDFECRPQYHIVKEFAEEVARSGNLSVFSRKKTVTDRALKSSFLEYQFNPA